MPHLTICVWSHQLSVSVSLTSSVKKYDKKILTVRSCSSRKNKKSIFDTGAEKHVKQISDRYENPTRFSLGWKPKPCIVLEQNKYSHI